MTHQELKDFLDEKADYYNQPLFIDTDPIQIPHLYTKKEDIEIAGFLAALIAWGNRKMIINNANKIMQLMGNNPFDFILNYDHPTDDILNFKHRTLNGEDLDQIFKSLHHIYHNHGGLESVFSRNNYLSLQDRISTFKGVFFENEHLARTQKHISDPAKGSAAKRINMFLRWMVRKDNKCVDFGLWNSIHTSELSCPLDVHSGTVARNLTLLKRKQNDRKALEELDLSLRSFDTNDPVKYDFALFGLGAIEKFE
jgi:uncharacterized protein (TIGR02757 family)